VAFEDIRHDVRSDGTKVGPLEKVPRPPYLCRQPGETNKDAIARIGGVALAAEHDRDTAQAAIRRAREAATDALDCCPECAGTARGILAALDGPGDDPAFVFRADDGREWRSDHGPDA
jgi:hypothetical protein